MAEVKKLEPPLALYDYVLYFECAKKDWLEGVKKSTVSGDGNLMNLINWNSTYSYDPDDKGGKTLFGVTENAWKAYVNSHPNSGYSKDLNTMGKNGWLDQISWFWNENSSAGECANYACAFMMFQMVWGGFSASNQKSLLNTLITNADIKEHSFIERGSVYKKIADATHAYTDPMVAYSHMRSALLSYYYNISSPNNNNKKYRVGWLNRAALPFTPYGLYIPVTVDGKSVGLKYESTLENWDSAVTQMIKSNTNGYVKIFDWGAKPESIEKISEGVYNYSSDSGSNSSGFNSSISSSGAYSGCGNIQQLGNYSNSTNTTISNSNKRNQNDNKEEVLNTLIKGAYSPNTIKRCAELLSTDKRKGVKVKSEV